MKIQFDEAGDQVGDIDTNGETVSYDQSQGSTTTTPGTIGDPNAPADYTDEELAAALPHTRGAGSPEQAELDGMRARINFLQAKANEISGYDPVTGAPVYAVGDLQRASFLNTVKNMTNGLELQLVMANRNIARRYLDSQKQAADAQATAAHYAALEERARQFTFDEEAKELAALMSKRKLGGERR